MAYSTIAEELLKQLGQLPLEYQKKVLEFAKALNTVAQGKSDQDLLKLAGTLDPENLNAPTQRAQRMQVMEEAVAYRYGITDNSNLVSVAQVVFNLPMEEQLELMEKMMSRLKEQSLKSNAAEFNWDEFYGIAKGLWTEDAKTT
jgi:anion-transporting  ArsA/GET3 family ATPase